MDTRRSPNEDVGARRHFTVAPTTDPDGHTGVKIEADEATKRWASEAKPSVTQPGAVSYGRAQVLGFLVDLVRQYQADRPNYRGVRLGTWERELADHEYTIESIAGYFRDRLREQFTRESFDVVAVETLDRPLVSGIRKGMSMQAAVMAMADHALEHGVPA